MSIDERKTVPGHASVSAPACRQPEHDPMSRQMNELYFAVLDLEKYGSGDEGRYTRIQHCYDGKRSADSLLLQLSNRVNRAYNACIITSAERDNTMPTSVQVCGNLWIGTRNAADEPHVTQNGFAYLVSCGAEFPAATKRTSPGVEEFQVPIVHESRCDISQHLRSGVSLVSSLLSRCHKEQRVLLYCCDGLGRSPFVALAYLVHYEGMDIQDAWAVIERKRPHIKANPAFMSSIERCFTI